MHLDASLMDVPTWKQLLAACIAQPGREPVGMTQVLRAKPPITTRDGWYTHQIPSFHLCLQGSAVIRHPDGEVFVRAGDIVFMEPCVEHRNVIRHDDYLMLHVGFMANRADVSLQSSDDWCLWSLPFDPLRGLVEQAMTAGDEEQRVSTTQALLTCIHAAELTLIGRRGTAVLEMLQGMWRVAYDGSSNAEEILHKSGLSRAQAYRTFTAIYGVGPARAVEVMRLDMARWLIYRGYRISDIAAWVGYSSPTAFGKRWTAQFGAPPRSFYGKLAPLPVGGYASNHTASTADTAPPE